MTNAFFNATGTPATRASGASGPIRAEFAAIEDAFDKFPAFTGNARRRLRVNAAETSVEAETDGWVSVLSYGALANGSDDYAAIQACINANPGKVIYFPAGSYYYGTKLVVQTDKTRLVGDGHAATTLVFTGTGDALQFKSASTASQWAYLNLAGMDGIRLYRSTTDNTGSGLVLTQCNSFRGGKVEIVNFARGYRQEGGQLVHWDCLSSTVSSATYTTPVANSYCFRFTHANVDGGLRQPLYTTHFNCIIAGGGSALTTCLLLDRTDGLQFATGYVAGGDEALMRIQPTYSGGHVSCVNTGSTYFDGVNVTTNGIEVLDDGLAGAAIVNNIDISGSVIGNLAGKGLYSTHPNIQTFIVEPANILNIAGTEVDVTSGDTGYLSWVGVRVPYTPTLTFQTPGNLSVSYATQVGRWLRTKDNRVIIDFEVTTSTFTHTTASGDLYILGVPFTSTAGVGAATYGSMVFQGITKAGYTQFMPRIGSSATGMVVFAAGSGVAVDTVKATDLPTGTTKTFIGSCTLIPSELG